jgi:FkbM family methyltransferase|tara:strand:- start:12320 stop:13036 length:717 start_codon:yes stop_codon:yes gene_type:complete
MINCKLSDEVLKRRVFSQPVNDHLQASTIMGCLDPFVYRHRPVIDVGAATGHFTHYFAPRCSEVIAFEAVPEVWMQLALKEKEFSNVVTHNRAVGDVYCGFVDFYVDDKRLSNSGFQDLVGGPKIKVPSVMLDSFLPKNLNPGFIKIDVEGTEIDVLKGGERLIETSRPNLLVEIYEPFSKGPLDEIFIWLMERGYETFYYNRPRLVPVLSVEDGVKAVKTKHKIHDGDFLFVTGKDA